MTSTTSKPFDLFPAPSHNLLPAGDFPKMSAGVTSSSTAALKRILEDNHKRWHVYFNDKGFHNHSAHSVIALWALGAHESILEASYKNSCEMQRSAFTSPNEIDSKNWKDYLGDENYYNAYLKFFTEEIKAKGPTATLEEYVFSANANIVAGKNGNPSMTSRFLAGLIHPLIHTGYGFEFGLPGIVAEGLAQTAIHDDRSSNIIPTSYFESASTISGLASKFGEVVGLNSSSSSKTPVHALTILARILADPQFEVKEGIDLFNLYSSIQEKNGDAIRKYVDQWTLEGPIEKKIEELVWVNAVIYGIGGREEGKSFNADFFQMHFVTSSIFLSTLAAQLSRNSQEILLKTYFSTCLVWYISRGRAAVDIKAFYEKTSVIPNTPDAKPKPNDNALPSASSEHAITPNAWFQILQSTLTHPDDHFVKIQRAFAHFASVYGLTPKGHFADTELKDAGELDGTLFVRAAILTAGRLGWIREGAELGGFDRRGFYPHSGPN